MVKANTRLSRHRQPTEKSQQGDFFSDAMNKKLLTSGQESREESNLPFHSHGSNIRGHYDTSVPPWDTRAAPPGSVESDSHLSSQQVSYPGQHRDHNARPVEADNQWNQYVAQSGLSRHARDANSKNIWSTKRLLPKVSDTSFFSASTNPSVGAFFEDAHNSQFQRSKPENHDNSIRDISESINRLHLKGLSNDSKTTTASVSSNNTYSTSNTIPGVVAASSGSTGGTGESSLTGQRHQPNHFHIRQHGQSMMNSSAKIYYPTLHNMQQKPPPGFRSYVSEEGNSIDPKNSISTSYNINRHSNRYQNDSRRGNSRKQIGKRHEEQNTERKHKTELEDSNRVNGNRHRKNRSKQSHIRFGLEFDNNSFATVEERSTTSSRAIRVIMNPQEKDATSSGVSLSSSNASTLAANRLPLDLLTEDNSQAIAGGATISSKLSNRAILPSINDVELESLRDEDDNDYYTDGDEEDSYFMGADLSIDNTTITNHSKKNDWLLRMNHRLVEIPVGNLDPSSTPISAIMNAWAKTKSSHGASMVEKWLNRAQEEFDAGNTKVVPTNKMFTMAVDAWAKSGEGISAAQRAEAILQHMNKKYQTTGLENLRPTTGIFNAVINAWARSKEKIAPSRAEQILKWMDNLHKANPSIHPDKYTFNTGM